MMDVLIICPERVRLGALAGAAGVRALPTPAPVSGRAVADPEGAPGGRDPALSLRTGVEEFQPGLVPAAFSQRFWGFWCECPVIDLGTLARNSIPAGWAAAPGSSWGEHPREGGLGPGIFWAWLWGPAPPSALSGRSRACRGAARSVTVTSDRKSAWHTVSPVPTGCCGQPHFFLVHSFTQQTSRVDAPVLGTVGNMGVQERAWWVRYMASNLTWGLVVKGTPQLALWRLLERGVQTPRESSEGQRGGACRTKDTGRQGEGRGLTCHSVHL